MPVGDIWIVHQQLKSCIFCVVGRQRTMAGSGSSLHVFEDDFHSRCAVSCCVTGSKVVSSWYFLNGNAALAV